MWTLAIPRMIPMGALGSPAILRITTRKSLALTLSIPFRFIGKLSPVSMRDLRSLGRRNCIRRRSKIKETRREWRGWHDMNGTTGYEAQFSWKWVFGVDGFLCMDGVLGHVFGFGLPLACLVEFDSIWVSIPGLSMVVVFKKSWREISKTCLLNSGYNYTWGVKSRLTDYRISTLSC